jgi:hypothetical protein
MTARTWHFRSTALILSAILSSAATPIVAFADDAHLVPQKDVVQRLVDTETTRAGRVALFEKALSTPEAEARARSLGFEPARLRAVVPQLSDAELKDLADRAARAKDPTAGYYRHDDGMILLGVVLVLLLVVLIVVASQNSYY